MMNCVFELREILKSKKIPCLSTKIERRDGVDVMEIRRANPPCGKTHFWIVSYDYGSWINRFSGAPIGKSGVVESDEKIVARMVESIEEFEPMPEFC